MKRNVILLLVLLVALGCHQLQKNTRSKVVSETNKQKTVTGRPQTPIMGWSSWNNFHANIDEGIIRAQADFMVSTGMKDAGYRYINIDDGFFGGRDAAGNLLAHPKRFPGGMRALSDYIHAKA